MKYYNVFPDLGSWLPATHDSAQCANLDELLETHIFRENKDLVLLLHGPLAEFYIFLGCFFCISKYKGFKKKERGAIMKLTICHGPTKVEKSVPGFVNFCPSGMEKALGASVISTKEALEKVQRVVLHPFFDIFFALVVFSNAIFIGLEVDSSMSGEWISPSTISVATYTYASLFALELLARLLGAGCSFFYSEDWMWNYLDITVVLASLVEIIATSISATADGGQSNVSGLKIFRIIRLTRVVKAVRLVRIFRFVTLAPFIFVPK